MGIIQEFKKFALRGNVVDMAVGIIMGGAFTGVVNSLVTDIIMPPLGLFTGEVDFTERSLRLQSQPQEVLLNYGVFLNTVINFLIVSLAVFLLVKAINAAQDAFDRGDAQAAPAPPPQEIQLLREIRDLLKKS